MDGISLVSCATWIQRGVCKEVPDKVELTKDELAKAIEATKVSLQTLDISNAEVDDESGDGMEENSEPIEGKPEDELDPYKFAKYDEEDEDLARNLLSLGQMTEFANEDDDPYLTRTEASAGGHQAAGGSDSDSDAEDLHVRPEENVIVTGQVDGEISQLVFYVFNEDEGSIYVHHDLLLSSYPLCVEWFSHDTELQTPGNLVAVGSMLPCIEVWDVDVINALEPAFRLGSRSKKKNGRSAVGHTDAVMSLAWNRRLGHVMASGSADHSVVLWDLDTRTVSAQLQCKQKVQSLAWRPDDCVDHLLTGDCGRFVRLWECRTESAGGRWKLSGEVEQLVWDHFSPAGAVAATDDGKLHYIDIRSDKKPVWSFQAHGESCTGISLSPSVPGCLISVSSDRSARVWDVRQPAPATPGVPAGPTLLATRPHKQGALHCVSVCPDLPWMTCVGGDSRDNPFRVWDVRQEERVRERFGVHRLAEGAGATPVDGASVDSSVTMETDSAVVGGSGTEPHTMTSQTTNNARPPKSKFKKKNKTRNSFK